MNSPLPSTNAIIQNVLQKKVRSLIDIGDAYEQMRVEPEHVHRTLFNTPDGTMESLVMQQGDTNGPASWQTLMNRIFAEYIGIFLDVYIDDLVIYSDTIEEHIEHLMKVFNVLRKQQIYLSTRDKVTLFAEKLVLLGHIIDEDGIMMDPDKVESVMNWKTPTNGKQTSAFLGTVGFLAPDCEGIRIPMGIMTPLTDKKSIWYWGPTEQCAFEETKEIVHSHRDQHRVAIDYRPGAPPVNLVADASLSGAGGTCYDSDRSTYPTRSIPIEHPRATRAVFAR